MRRLAIKSALSSKVADNEFVVLDSLSLAAPKTKDFAKILSNLKADRKALVVVGEMDNTLALSSRNIPGVKLVSAEGINVLDLLNHDKVIFTKDAVAKVEEVLA